MQIAFEIEANLQDPTKKPSTIEIFYWLNRALEKFTKTRYDGFNIKGQGFEDTQKRIDDLSTLVKEVTISTSGGSIKPNSYIASLPNDYMFSLGEECSITYLNNVGNPITIRVPVYEVSIDRYSREVINPFSEFILQYNTAKPLRLFYETYIELISDGNYTIPTFYLRYLKEPVTIALPSTSCDLPDHTHYEIVKIATQMFIENQGNNRYNTYSNEVNSME